MSATGISILTLSRSESRISKDLHTRKATEHFAHSAAKIALARLQEIAGTDNVATSTNPVAEKEFPHVAWNVSNPPAHFPEKISSNTPVPLCSGTEQSDSNEYAEFPRKHLNGQQLSAPWEYVGEKFRFAYLIIDETQKFPLVPPKQVAPKARSINPNEKQRRNQLLNFNYINEKEFSAPQGRRKISGDKIQMAQYAPKLFFAENPFDKICEKSAAPDTFGVIADWQRNRLKRDLSDEAYADEIFPKNLLKNLEEALPEFPYAGLPIARSIPKEIGKLGTRLNIIPVPVDLKLHVGFINARSDGQHRARFHITAKLWNPNSFPILAHADGQLGIIDFSSMPTFFIQNLNTGGKFSVNLSDFPTGRFGLVRQTPSDKTFNAYCKIFDDTDQGFGTSEEYPEAGLHAGEIYLARFPSPEGQANGLSRITGGPTWKFQKGSNPQKPPSKAIEGRWFHSSHRINIFSMPSMFPGEIVLRHYNGSFPQSTCPEDYSEPIFRIKNILFPYTDFVITGKEYNREKAGDYSISQAHLVYRIRLKVEDENAMKEFLENCDLRNGVLDFGNPIIAKAFHVSAHTGQEASRLAEEENSGYFFDRFANAHKTEETSPAFSCIQIYDLPNRRHASVGTLRFIQQKQLPPLSIGKFSDTAKNKKINQFFDRYFFSLKERNEKSITSENPLFVHKDLKRTLNKLSFPEEENFSESCMIRGPFNVNSVNEKAWEAILSNVFNDWEQHSGRFGERKMPWDKNGGIKNLKNVFFTRPFSAQFFSPNGKIIPLEDTDLEKAPLRSREQFLLEQGFRSLDSVKIATLAKHIAKITKERIAAKNPFLSISDFADSGILENGIAQAEINEIGGIKIPAWFPNFLKQEHILETLNLRASPRGDTFSIILRAEKINPLTRQIESGTNLEMRIQRIPDLFDGSQKAGSDYDTCNGKNRRFGRRFKIENVKFLPN